MLSATRVLHTTQNLVRSALWDACQSKNPIILILSGYNLDLSIRSLATAQTPVPAQPKAAAPELWHSFDLTHHHTTILSGVRTTFLAIYPYPLIEILESDIPPHTAKMPMTTLAPT